MPNLIKTLNNLICNQEGKFATYFHQLGHLIRITTIQCNLSKPDPNGTKYFVRFRQDPDYSDSSFLEEFLHFSCFDNKVCLLLDGLAYILHFIHLFYVNQMLKVFIQRHLKQEAHAGHCRSPEYNERVKNLTSEWNQKQQSFIPHASRSLLCIRFVAAAFWAKKQFF